MAIRFSNEVMIRLSFTGRWDDANRSIYEGRVTCKGYAWSFRNLAVHPKGASDSKESYDRAAESALSFAAYYTSDNRGAEDDLSDYPSPEAADTFSENASYTPDNERDTQVPGGYFGDLYAVFRTKDAEAKCWAERDAKTLAGEK